MAVIKIVPMPGAVGDKGDPGETGAQGPQGETGLQGPAGADALWNYNGEWQLNSSYATGDVVTYQGQLYYAKAITTAGTLPTDTSKFDLIAAKGADGEPGLNGLEGETGPQGPAGEDALWNFLGEYNGGADYNIGDVVTYNGGTYYRILPLNAGYAPGTEYWTTIAAPGADADVSFQSIRWTPSFTATGLTFTGSESTHPTYNSYYVKAGKMVTFAIEVDCSTVTNFGTGQFKLQLPFTPAIGFNHFTGWANVDTAVNPDVEDGHVILNVDHSGLTDVLDLHYLKQAGGAHSPIIEGLFLQGTPVTLTTSSKIYVNGTYISQ